MTDQCTQHSKEGIRALLAAENPVVGERPYPPEHAVALAQAFCASPHRDAVKSSSRRARVRGIVIGLSFSGVLAVGGLTAAAGLRPAGEVATAPLSPPIILNGVGPAVVPMPAAPERATYLRLELTCFDGTVCETSGGSVTSDQPSVMVQRDALPLTSRPDPDNPQMLPQLDPVRGLALTVEAGTHWRLYAVYVDSLNPRQAELPDGRTLGVANNSDVSDLVPAVATNGRPGWVDYRQLTDQAHPVLTTDGLSQRPIPVYDQDGTTVIGSADVSRSIP